MKYAILAAGKAERIRINNPELEKPMLEIKGIPIIERLIRIFVDNEATDIYIITNNSNQKTISHLKYLSNEFDNVNIKTIIKNTESPLESLYELLQFIENSSICITTVDTIFNSQEFSNFIFKFKNSLIDGLMAVTNYVNDTKPLYISTFSNLIIKDFLDYTDKIQYISGGIYALKSNCLKALRKIPYSNSKRLRTFQKLLISERFVLEAFPFSKIFDIDRLSELNEANKYFKKNDTVIRDF